MEFFLFYDQLFAQSFRLRYIYNAASHKIKPYLCVAYKIKSLLLRHRYRSQLQKHFRMLHAVAAHLIFNITNGTVHRSPSMISAPYLRIKKFTQLKAWLVMLCNALVTY